MDQDQWQEYDAFISYSSLDRTQVRRIHRFLESYPLNSKARRRLKVFFDETDIRGGALRPEIETALSRSRILIVCCTPDAKKSEWVDKEIRAFNFLRKDPNIALALLSGTPENSIPEAALPLEPRHHDLRNGWIIGVLKPKARDELLRLLALITQRDLRSLINWHKRRTLSTLASGIAVTGLSISGIRHYLTEQRKIDAHSILVRIIFTPLGENTEARFLEIFKEGSAVTLYAITKPVPIKHKIDDWRDGESTTRRIAEVSLESTTQSSSHLTRETVDGAQYQAIRVFDKFSGNVAHLDSLTKWRGALIKIWFKCSIGTAKNPEEMTKEYDSDRIRNDFRTTYSITPEKEDEWGDYSASPLPILAKLEVSIDGSVIGRTEGYVTRVHEWDEDVRRLHVVNFPPFKA